MTVLEVRNLTVRYDGQLAADGVNFTLEEGQWLMLAGPNGAGKSTLISAIAQGVPYTGQVLVNGMDARTMKPAKRARLMGVLSQHHSVNYAYTVEEIVRLGRYAHAGGFLRSRDLGGERLMEEALERTGMTALRHQSILELSGGEKQRAFLAQVFAQDPQILLLDEPANHLDLLYQKHIFSLIGEWLQKPGRAVLSVVHDLSLARKYGTHAVLLDHGRCAAQGTMAETLTPEHLQAVYGMDVHAWMQDMLKQWENHKGR